MLSIPTHIQLRFLILEAYHERLVLGVALSITYQSINQCVVGIFSQPQKCLKTAFVLNIYVVPTQIMKLSKF